jgi:hypothetical protein
VERACLGEQAGWFDSNPFLLGEVTYPTFYHWYTSLAPEKKESLPYFLPLRLFFIRVLLCMHKQAFLVRVQTLLFSPVAFQLLTTLLKEALVGVRNRVNLLGTIYRFCFLVSAFSKIVVQHGSFRSRLYAQYACCFCTSWRARLENVYFLW